MKKPFLPNRWQAIDSAPPGTDVMLRVQTEGRDFMSTGEYILPFPCKLTSEGWVNARTGSRLTVQPVAWQPYPPK